jgi:hypothetical protein
VRTRRHKSVNRVELLNSSRFSLLDAIVACVLPCYDLQVRSTAAPVQEAMKSREGGSEYLIAQLSG